MRLTDLRRRLPLRTQLIVIVIAVVTVALGLTSVVAASLLRDQLYDRVDAQLLAGPGRGRISATIPPSPPTGARPAPGGLPRLYVATLLDAQGKVVDQIGEDTDTGPRLQGLTGTEVARRDAAPFTVDAVEGNGRWRVIVRAVDTTRSLAVALPLDEVDDTVNRLLRVIAAASAVSVAVGGALAWAAVRRSLRPLVEVETTAHAIAAGDLTVRVPPAPTTTEVGSLAESFNAMVDRFQSAYQAQQASEETARASEDRMRQFVADASHELRTPLTTVLGYTDLYERGGIDSQGHLDRVIRRVDKEAKRMRLLVDDLLQLARLDQQRPPAREIVDLAAICSDVVHDAQVHATAHLITLEANGEALTVGDEASLRQVIGNLVANAVAHTPAGTTVTVRVLTRLDDAVVEVHDDGPGMTPEVAARVFERFFRGDASRSRTNSTAGSGLGLAIARDLVHAHCGRIMLDTDVGAGATFAVCLPRTSGSTP